MIQFLVDRLARKHVAAEQVLRNVWLTRLDRWDDFHTTFYRMRYKSWIDNLMQKNGVGGITFGASVLVRFDCWHRVENAPHETSAFVLHEMVHHMQYERSRWTSLQLLKYGARYVWLYLFVWGKHPYFDNYYEREARALAEQGDPEWKRRGHNRWRPWKIGG